MNASNVALLLVRVVVVGGGIALGVAVVATAGLLATFWRPK